MPASLRGARHSRPRCAGRRPPSSASRAGHSVSTGGEGQHSRLGRFATCSPRRVSVNGNTFLPFPTGTYGPMYFVSDFSPPCLRAGSSTSPAMTSTATSFPAEYETTDRGNLALRRPGDLPGCASGATAPSTQSIGVGQDDYANLPDWQLTQVVGLPAKPGEISPAYDSPPSRATSLPHRRLRRGRRAAASITELLLRYPLPGTGDPKFPAAAVAAVTLAAVPATTSARPDNLLSMIGAALQPASTRIPPRCSRSTARQ